MRCNPRDVSIAATRAFISTSVSPVAAPAQAIAIGNSHHTGACPGRAKASAISVTDNGNARRPIAAPNPDATSIALIAAIGVRKISRPSCRSSTPSIAFRSGRTAAKVPHNTPMAAKAAIAGRA